MTYYLYSESETGLYLAKAEHYEYLISIINRCKIKEWTIGDMPINYEEKEYVNITSQFLEQSTEEIIDFFHILSLGPIQ